MGGWKNGRCKRDPGPNSAASHGKNSSKVSVIVTFLVILELIKTGFVTVQQENTMADIEITVVKDPDLIEDIEEE